MAHFLAANWIWILLVGGMLYMYVGRRRRGHMGHMGGCGGHGTGRSGTASGAEDHRHGGPVAGEGPPAAPVRRGGCC